MNPDVPVAVPFSMATYYRTSDILAYDQPLIKLFT